MATLAILGGGQLGRMLAEAAGALGVSPRCFDPHAGCSASHACDVTPGSFGDLDAVKRFAEGADVVTCEWESVPLETLEAAASVAPLRPGIESFRAARDRFEEHALFQRAGVPTPRSLNVRTDADVREAIESIGGPVVLKARFGGYDGKGQARLGPGDAIAGVLEPLGGEAICQELVPFDREVSVVLARGLDGTTQAYPPIENVHASGILFTSVAPAPGLAPQTSHALLQRAAQLADELGHVGVLAVEFFLVRSGGVVANEIAPRVHNSGHWTLSERVIDASLPSQFEQHVRAVMGLSLRPVPRDVGFRGMVNVVGEVGPEAMTPGGATGIGSGGCVWSKWYDKQPRAGRKLGHLCVKADTPDARNRLMDDISAQVGTPAPP